MELKGKRVLVVGLGKTGVALAGFLAGRGAEVIISDKKPESELKENCDALKGMRVTFDVGRHNADILSQVDMIIPSPGVPPFNELLTGGVERGIPIISEIELAFSYLKEPVIAITGTNGKTTTTKLLGEILKKWGKKIFVGGNIGNPLIEYVDGGERADYLVVEVSSFQLQWVKQFHPSVAVLLNTSSDHLDYHANFEAYVSMKERIFANQAPGDLAIFNADDAIAGEVSKKIRGDILYFSSSQKLERGIFIDNGVLRYRNSGGMEEEYPVGKVKLKGIHNLENVMAAVIASRRCGCPQKVIVEALETFKGMPHRMEFVRSRGGVEIYNDSKGTNVDAVKRALESFSGSVILLMGGRDKGGDYGILAGLIGEKVKKLVLFGEAREKIRSFLGKVVDMGSAENLKGAMEEACKSSSPGDVILLSPGCSSFDEFANYRERGNYFKEMAREL